MNVNKKDKSNSFIKQGAFLAIASIISRFIGFLYRLPLTNLIGDEGNSIYGNGYYIYMLFLLISSAGLPVAISKMVSARAAENRFRDAHQVLKISLIIGGALGLIGTFAMLFGAKNISILIRNERSYLTLLSLAPTIFIVAILSSFRGYFQGLNTTIPTAISQLVEQIFNAGFSILLAYLFINTSLELAVAGATAATGIGAIVGLMVIVFIYILARKNILLRVKSDITIPKNFESNSSIARELLKISVPIILGSAIFSFTNIIDMIMVKRILVERNGFDEIYAETLYGQLSGKYNTLTTLPVSISTALGIAAIPSISASAKLGNKKDLEHKINTSLRITMIISVPAAIGIGVLGDPILKLLFPSYPDGGILLKVGAVSIIFLALTQITTSMLQGIGKVKTPAFAALCGTLLKIPLNLIFISIPSINVVGAVISTIFCYLVASTIDLYFLMKETKANIDFNSILIKPIVSSLIMGLSCYVFYGITNFITKSNSLGVLISILLSVFVYFFAMILLKGLTDEDILLIPFGNKILPILKKYNI